MTDERLDLGNAMMHAFWRHDGQLVSVQLSGMLGLMSGTVAMEPGRLPVLRSANGTPVYINPQHVIVLIPGVVDIGLTSGSGGAKGGPDAGH